MRVHRNSRNFFFVQPPYCGIVLTINCDTGTKNVPDTHLRVSVDPSTERIFYKASLFIVRRGLLFLLSKVHGRIQRRFKGFVGELLA